jgi:hypothetical protein
LKTGVAYFRHRGNGGVAFRNANGQKKRPQLGGQAEAVLGLMPGAARQDSNVGSRSAVAINFCVKVA